MKRFQRNEQKKFDAVMGTLDDLTRYYYGLAPVTIREDKLNEIINQLKKDIIKDYPDSKVIRSVLDDIDVNTTREEIGCWAFKLKATITKIQSL